MALMQESSVVRFGRKVASFPFRLRDFFQCRYLRTLVDASDGAVLSAQAEIHNPFRPKAIRIGANTLFMGQVIVLREGATVEIGEWSFVGPSAKLWAMESIRIGSRVQVSHGVHVFDNNSHSLSAQERHNGFRKLMESGTRDPTENIAHAAISIEDDVWIGFNAAIMKGVTIGQGAIIGANAVITKDVERFSMMVGNPARKVGESRA